MASKQQRAAMQDAWRYRGRDRPSFAIEPGPGQESVWDYPRPPAVVDCQRHVTVSTGAYVIAATRAAIRVLETASPPTFYLPPKDIDFSLLSPSEASSFCEWKGRAVYWDVEDGGRPITCAAWAYPQAGGRFAPIAGYLAFYPDGLICTVGGYRVDAQAGTFYGGWVTDEIVGPFKGEPGTGGW